MNLRLHTLTVLLALGGSAVAQNAFRPLPELPMWSEWPGPATPSPAARAAAWFEQLEADSQLPRERTFVEARVFAEGASGAKFDGGGSLASQRGGLVATIGTELGEQRIAALSVRTEASFYNLGGANGLVPGENEPFNDLYRTSVSGLVRSSAQSGLGWFGGFYVALGGEDDASASESLVLGTAGGVRHRTNDDFEIELGIAALSRLEDDPWIWPYIGFHWRASDWLEFSAQGTTLEARAALDRKWSVVGRAEYLIQQFRLNDDNPLPRGVLRDDEIRAGVGIAHRADNGFGFELIAGLNLWRELSTLDSSGAKVAEDELEMTPYLALSLNLSF